MPDARDLDLRRTETARRLRRLRGWRGGVACVPHAAAREASASARQGPGYCRASSKPGAGKMPRSRGLLGLFSCHRMRLSVRLLLDTCRGRKSVPRPSRSPCQDSGDVNIGGHVDVTRDMFASGRVAVGNRARDPAAGPITKRRVRDRWDMHFATRRLPRAAHDSTHLASRKSRANKVFYAQKCNFSRPSEQSEPHIIWGHCESTQKEQLNVGIEPTTS